MKQAKGFTLVELLVVVAVIAMVVSVFVLMPRGGSKELARQALCGANLNAIGKGFVIYMSESDDAPPWIDSSDWSSATGTNAESTSTPAKVSPTALMFLIVRSGQPVDLFRCPRDENASKMVTTRFTSGGNNYYYWDFCDTEKSNPTAADNCKKVSYSIQAPLYDSTAKTYITGFTAASRGGLAIMADKTPGFDGKTPCTNWAGSLSKKQRKAGMSQNHKSGDFINVLYADCHVSGGSGQTLVSKMTTSTALPTMPMPVRRGQEAPL